MKVILCKCTKCATLVPAMTRFPEKLWMEGREGARGGAADLPTSSESTDTGTGYPDSCIVLCPDNKQLPDHLLYSLGKIHLTRQTILFVFIVFPKLGVKGVEQLSRIFPPRYSLSII